MGFQKWLSELRVTAPVTENKNKMEKSSRLKTPRHRRSAAARGVRLQVCLGQHGGRPISISLRIAPNALMLAASGTSAGGD
jgi:hypothetical protein